MRILSNEQLADGTRISLRLAQVLRNVAARWNNIRRGDLRRPFMPVHLVCGYSPGNPDLATDRLPFMKGYVADADVIAAGADVEDVLKNRYRVKGYSVPEIVEHNGTGAHYIWSTTWVFPRPMRVVAATVWLITDSIYSNTFQYAGGHPKAGTTSDDFSAVLETDDPFAPEDRRKTSLLWLRNGDDLDSWKFSQIAPAPVSDGTYTTPEWTGKMPEGLMFTDQDLNIPLPAGSRLRLSLVLPDYAQTAWSGWHLAGPPEEFPWERQRMGWNLVLAEGVH